MDESPPPQKKQRKHSRSKEIRASYDPDSFEEKIERFQKEAIYRQLLEYKREASKCEEEAKSTLSQKEAREEQMGVVLSELQLIYDQIECLFDELGLAGEARKFDSLELLGDILENQIEVTEFKRQLNDQRKSTVVLFSQLKSALVKLQDHGQDFLSKVNGTKDSSVKGFVEIQAKLLNGFKSSRPISKSIEEINDLKEKLRYLEVSKKTTDESLKQKLEDIEDIEERIKGYEKKIDRLEMLVQKKSTEKSHHSPGASASDVIAAVSSSSVTSELKERYLNEIKALRNERAEHLTQLDTLKANANDVPDSIILNSYIFKDMAIQANHFEHEYENVLKVNDSLRSELDMLVREKEQVLDKLQFEEEMRKTRMDTDFKKLMADLTRIRKHRETLQAENIIHKAQEEIKLQEKDAMRNMFSVQENMIKQLSSEINRLRYKVAYLLNDNDAIKFVEENPDIITTDDSLSKLSKLEQANQELEKRLSELIANSSDSTLIEQTLAIRNKNEMEITDLREQVKKYQHELELTASLSQNSDLVAKLQEHESKIKDLQAHVNFQAATEAKLSQELEQLKASYSDFAITQANNVAELGRKEDHIAQIVKDRMKCEHRIAQLTREHEQATHLGNTLKRQAEKLHEYIRKLEDQGKNLTFQIKTLERDVKASNDARFQTEQKLKEASRINQEFKSKLDLSNLKYSELEISLSYKNHELEEEISKKNRLQDDIEILTKKFNSLLSASKHKTDEGLESTVEEYKTLLKCTSCALRFKSHALIRCMHVFCKECIDTRLGTRQRKCPTCNEPFGANDVRQIYL